MEQLVFVVLNSELPIQGIFDAIEALKKVPGVLSAAPVEHVVAELAAAGCHDRRKYHGTTKR